MDFNSLVDHYILEGYRLDCIHDTSYASFFMDFPNGNVPVNDGDQIECGERVEITNFDGKLEVRWALYYKRGWLWSGSAYTTKNKGNVYAYGQTMTIPPYSRQSGEITALTTNL